MTALTRRVVREVLEQSNVDEDSEVSVLFVGDEEMRGLNARYRGLDRTTDVLAFAMSEGEAFPREGTRLLGDVVVSLETAERQAGERKHSVRREIAILLVHGVLHLLGYDHEASRQDAGKAAARARRMRRMERGCVDRLESLGILSMSDRDSKR